MAATDAADAAAEAAAEAFLQKPPSTRRASDAAPSLSALPRAAGSSGPYAEKRDLLTLALAPGGRWGCAIGSGAEEEGPSPDEKDRASRSPEPAAATDDDGGGDQAKGAPSEPPPRRRRCLSSQGLPAPSLPPPPPPAAAAASAASAEA